MTDNEEETEAKMEAECTQEPELEIKNEIQHLTHGSEFCNG